VHFFSRLQVLRDKSDSTFGNLAQKTPKGEELKFKASPKWLSNCLTTPRDSRKLTKQFAEYWIETNRTEGDTLPKDSPH